MAAGLKPDEYLECSLGEVVHMIKGWQEREIVEWRRVRELKYAIYCVMTEKPAPIYEFMPLDGDPTPEEIEALKQQEEEARKQEIAEVYNQYKNLGLI